MEKMKILLAKADCDRVFNFLDKANCGSLNFNQFCGLVEETRYREIDPYQLKTIEEAINDKVIKERYQEKEQKQQEQLEKLSQASSHYTGLKTVKSFDRKLKTQRIKGIHPDVELMRPSGVPNLPSDNIQDIMTN